MAIARAEQFNEGKGSQGRRLDTGSHGLAKRVMKVVMKQAKEEDVEVADADCIYRS